MSQSNPPHASSVRSKSESAILAELRQQTWMGRHPESRSQTESVRWLKVKITDFRLGEGKTADQVRAKFLGLPTAHSEWFSTDTDEVVPSHDPAHKWEHQGDNTYTRMDRNSALHKHSASHKDSAAKPPAKVTITARTAAVDTSVDSPTKDLLRDHYYRVEVTAFDSGAVTLSWYYPPGNPRDTSSWIGLYPLRGDPPVVPPSPTLRPNRATFKYLTKNNTSGEDGAVVSVETTGGQASPHDGVINRIGLRGSRKPATPRSIANASDTPNVPSESKSVVHRKPKQQAARPVVEQPPQLDDSPDTTSDKSAGAEECHTANIPSLKNDTEKGAEGESSAKSETAENDEERITDTAKTPAKEAPRPQPLGHENDQSEEPDGGAAALLATLHQGVPCNQIFEPDVEEPPDDGNAWFQVRVREVTGSTLSINWAFPPGNPSDSSAYMSLYPMFEWETLELPYSRPNPSVFGYKYITQNGMHGVVNFTLNAQTGNPMHDGLYVFALHCQDVVQALSQPIRVKGLHVVEIQPHTAMRRCMHTPILSRNRQRSKPAALPPVGMPTSAPPPNRDRKKRKRSEPKAASEPSSLASDALLAACKTSSSKSARSGGVPLPDKVRPQADKVTMKHVPFKKKTKVTAQAAPAPPRTNFNNILQCAEELELEQAGWIFSCQCGLTGKEVDDGSAMVQCDKCSKWQHANCVGVKPAALAESKYLCWKCESRVPLKHRKRKLANDFQPAPAAAVEEKYSSELNEQKGAMALAAGALAAGKESGVHRAAGIAARLLRGMPSDGYNSLSRNLGGGGGGASGLVNMNLSTEEAVPWSRRLDQMQSRNPVSVKPYELQNSYPGNYAWCNPEVHGMPHPMDRSGAASEIGRGAQAMWEMRNMAHMPFHSPDGGGMHHLAAQQMGYCVQPAMHHLAAQQMGNLPADAEVIQTQPYQYPHGWMNGNQNGNQHQGY